MYKAWWEKELRGSSKNGRIIKPVYLCMYVCVCVYVGIFESMLEKSYRGSKRVLIYPPLSYSITPSSSSPLPRPLPFFLLLHPGECFSLWIRQFSASQASFSLSYLLANIYIPGSFLIPFFLPLFNPPAQPPKPIAISLFSHRDWFIPPPLSRRRRRDSLIWWVTPIKDKESNSAVSAR